MPQHNHKINSSESKNSEVQQDETESSETLPTSNEIGGPQGLEPTRYGDWERKGRCIDF